MCFKIRMFRPTRGWHFYIGCPETLHNDFLTIEVTTTSVTWLPPELRCRSGAALPSPSRRSLSVVMKRWWADFAMPTDDIVPYARGWHVSVAFEAEYFLLVTLPVKHHDGQADRNAIRWYQSPQVWRLHIISLPEPQRSGLGPIVSRTEVGERCGITTLLFAIKLKPKLNWASDEKTSLCIPPHTLGSGIWVLTGRVIPAGYLGIHETP